MFCVAWLQNFVDKIFGMGGVVYLIYGIAALAEVIYIVATWNHPSLSLETYQDTCVRPRGLLPAWATFVAVFVSTTATFIISGAGAGNRVGTGNASNGRCHCAKAVLSVLMLGNFLATNAVAYQRIYGVVRETGSPLCAITVMAVTPLLIQYSHCIFVFRSLAASAPQIWTVMHMHLDHPLVCDGDEETVNKWNMKRNDCLQELGEPPIKMPEAPFCTATLYRSLVLLLGSLYALCIFLHFLVFVALYLPVWCAVYLFSTAVAIPSSAAVISVPIMIYALVLQHQERAHRSENDDADNSGGSVVLSRLSQDWKPCRGNENDDTDSTDDSDEYDGAEDEILFEEEHLDLQEPDTLELKAAILKKLAGAFPGEITLRRLLMASISTETFYERNKRFFEITGSTWFGWLLALGYPYCFGLAGSWFVLVPTRLMLALKEGMSFREAYVQAMSITFWERTMPGYVGYIAEKFEEAHNLTGTNSTFYTVYAKTAVKLVSPWLR